MPIRFSCPNETCKSQFVIADDVVGRPVRCPKCNQTCTAPGPAASHTDAETGNRTPPPAVHDEYSATFLTHDISVADTSSDMPLLDRFMEARGVGQVTIERQTELARGGMGAVIRGMDRILHRPVAIKVMNERLAKSDRHRLRFMEEAQITGQLEHPNIVPVHELGKDTEGKLYITMKLVQGRSLGQILKAMRKESEPGPPLSELLSMFLKICDGMAFAHSKNVIHRDLKPDNVMVGDFGEVLVMDWGLARIVQASAFSFLDGNAQAIGGASPDVDWVGDPGQTGPMGVDETQAIGRRVRSVRSDTDQGATVAGSVIGTPAYRQPVNSTRSISGPTSTRWAESSTRC